MKIDIFEKRDLNDFSKNIRTVFNLMTISRKYKVVGSASLKNIRYIADYDLNETFSSDLSEEQCLDKIYTLFRDKFNEAKKNSNWFITDFKCGEDSDGEALRWNSNDIKKGFKKMVNGNEIKFVDCVLMKSTMKLDMIALINGKFHEFSDNYLIKIRDKTNFFPHDLEPAHLLNNLKHDFSFYFYSQKNYFKALKRAFSYWSLENKVKNIVKLTTLFDLFNSTIGFFYKLFGELNIIELVIQNTFRKPKIIDIKCNIEIMIDQLQPYNLHAIESHLKQSLDAVSSKAMLKHLNEAKDLFFKKINNAAKKFIQEHPEYILVR